MLARRPAAALVVSLLALVSVALGGCSSRSAGTPNQGANADAGQVAIRNAVIVAGPAGSSTASVVVTLVNSSAAEDKLTGVEVSDPAPSSTSITNGAIDLPPNRTVVVGHTGESHINLYGFTPTPSQIVDVVFVLRDHGRVTLEVKVVPPTGAYEGIVPVPSTPPSS